VQGGFFGKVRFCRDSRVSSLEHKGTAFDASGGSRAPRFARTSKGGCAGSPSTRSRAIPHTKGLCGTEPNRSSKNPLCAPTNNINKKQVVFPPRRAKGFRRVQGIFFGIRDEDASGNPLVRVPQLLLAPHAKTRRPKGEKTMSSYPSGSWGLGVRNRTLSE
jgi:hypothetical protein